MALTLKRVAKLVRQGKAGKYADAGGVRGLYLVVVGKEAASWQLRYQLRHAKHWMGLGSARDFNLLQARPRAIAARQQLADGVDPLTQKRQLRAIQAVADATTKTFRECAEQFIRDHQSKWKSGAHGAQWRGSLQQYAYPKIGDIDVDKIAKPHVLQVLEQPVPAALGYPAGKFWSVRSVTASRVRSRLELILSWAKARGYRTVAENPAAWSDLKHILPAPAKIAKVEHLPAVAYGELPLLVAKLHSSKGVAAKALLFEILTATRPTETTEAVWDEIDLDSATWVIPATRMKSGREHKVPLVPAAIELLRSLHTEEGNEHVFLGSRQPALSGAAMRRLLQRLGYGNATPHGTARSGFSDWAHERSSFNNHVIELSLAHAIGSSVEKAYRRGEMFDKRRKLMEAWATYLTTAPVAPAKSAATVTPIRGAAP